MEMWCRKKVWGEEIEKKVNKKKKIGIGKMIFLY